VKILYSVVVVSIRNMKPSCWLYAGGYVFKIEISLVSDEIDNLELEASLW
jgi:hypothetical protein